ncbi:helix-turn-helix transcriptional regulator [Streptomyces beijiangensis]|uniref:Uncharacterized protein n=1 Tax=Streptomyces beijiangensis TaxID=163361 RepID=A0A939FEB9_9ACTN|nr:hypothetical protein [Streptomyces beijiangensis]MBO0516779.1 hypothetical protein [Streptomyces beijiangensis]
MTAAPPPVPTPYVDAAQIVAEFGASRSRLSEWLRDRERTGFPAVDHLDGRKQIWERTAVADWFAQRTAHPAGSDGLLGEGQDPDELLSTAEVARILKYKRVTTIHAYLKDRPGYFPEPDVTGTLPAAPPRPGRPNTTWWRRSTITNWAATRPGKGNTEPKTRTVRTPPPTEAHESPNDLLTAGEAAPLLGYKNAASFTSALAQGALPHLLPPDGYKSGARGGPHRAWRRGRIQTAANN